MKTFFYQMCSIMRKTDIPPCENKGANQLCIINCTADQHLCFCYMDSTKFFFYIYPKFQAASVTVQVGLCPTWSEIQIVGFLMGRLICKPAHQNTNNLHIDRDADQCLCFHSIISTMRFLSNLKFHTSSLLSDCTGWFVSDLVRDPDCWFSETLLYHTNS